MQAGSKPEYLDYSAHGGTILIRSPINDLGLFVVGEIADLVVGYIDVDPIAHLAQGEQSTVRSDRCNHELLLVDTKAGVRLRDNVTNVDLAASATAKHLKGSIVVARIL
jgi:hypothetical protein